MESQTPCSWYYSKEVVKYIIESTIKKKEIINITQISTERGWC